jgi:hypothetical protein
MIRIARVDSIHNRVVCLFGRGSLDDNCRIIPRGNREDRLPSRRFFHLQHVDSARPWLHARPEDARRHVAWGGNIVFRMEPIMVGFNFPKSMNYKSADSWA